MALWSFLILTIAIKKFDFLVIWIRLYGEVVLFAFVGGIISDWLNFLFLRSGWLLNGNIAMHLYVHCFHLRSHTQHVFLILQIINYSFSRYWFNCHPNILLGYTWAIKDIVVRIWLIQSERLCLLETNGLFIGWVEAAEVFLNLILGKRCSIKVFHICVLIKLFHIRSRCTDNHIFTIHLNNLASC